MKSFILLFHSLFVIFVHSTRLPSELLHKISSQLRITTLVQLPLPFQSKEVLRNHLIRFLDEGYFEGQNTGNSKIFKDPAVIPTLNKVYFLLNELGIDGMSRQRMLKPFPLFQIRPNEYEWKKLFFDLMFEQISLGTLRPIFALFWIEDVYVVDTAFNNPLWGNALIHIAYKKGISDEKWAKQINEKLHGFPMTKEQEKYLINQKHSLYTSFLEPWLMKDRQFPIKNKKIITELKVNGRGISSDGIITRLLNYDYLRDFIKISNELVLSFIAEINPRIVTMQQNLNQGRRLNNLNEEQFDKFSSFIEKLRGLLQWLNEQNK